MCAEGNQVGQAPGFGLLNVRKRFLQIRLVLRRRQVHRHEALVDFELVLEKNNLQLFAAKMAAEVFQTLVSLAEGFVGGVRFTGCLLNLPENKVRLVAESGSLGLL